MKEKNFIQQLLWDSKASCYSMSRFMMLTGFFITGIVMMVVLWIVIDSYRSGMPIPDLAWLAYGGSGSAVSGVFGYFANRYGSADQPFPEVTPKAQLEGDQ